MRRAGSSGSARGSFQCTRGALQPAAPRTMGSPCKKSCACALPSTIVLFSPSLRIVVCMKWPCPRCRLAPTGALPFVSRSGLWRRNTGTSQRGHRLSASRILWRFSAWCPTALVASALSQNGRSATSASLEQKQCPSCNLRGEALWWASRAVHLHVQEKSTGGDRTQV